MNFLKKYRLWDDSLRSPIDPFPFPQKKVKMSLNKYEVSRKWRNSYSRKSATWLKQTNQPTNKNTVTVLNTWATTGSIPLPPPGCQHFSSPPTPSWRGPIPGKFDQDLWGSFHLAIPHSWDRAPVQVWEIKNARPGMPSPPFCSSQGFDLEKIS